MRMRGNRLGSFLVYGLQIALAIVLIVSLARKTACAGEGAGIGGFLGEGIDFKGGMLDWEEDDNGRKVAVLRNYAVVILPQLTISARNMVLNVELQEIYAEGDVLFQEPTGNAFYCDQLTFNYQEWKGLAKNIRIKAEKAGVELPVRDFLDTAPSVNIGGASSINDTGISDVRRMYVQAQELRAHDAQTFELIDAKITPDPYYQPHWYFHSPAALLRQGEKIESYHNTVRVGRFPLLYFPYLIRDLQYDWPWMRLSAGYTGDYGYFVRTQWGWQLKPRPNSYLDIRKIIFDLDWFSRRGAGVGAESTYKVGRLESQGKFKLYGVYEYGISRQDDLQRAYGKNEDKVYYDHLAYDPITNTSYPVPRKDVYGNDIPFTPSLYRNKFRWAVDWEHYQQLNEMWDVRAEAHLYHDRDYLREYDPARYWNDKVPENSIDFRRLDKHWELEFVAQSRLSNKWQTQPDYTPEVRLTVPGLQLGQLPLYFKNDFRMGVVNRRFDEDEYRYTQRTDDGLFALDTNGLSASRLYDKDNYGSFFRAFNEARVDAPIKVFDTLTFKPWVGVRTAYYQHTLGTPIPYNEMSQADKDAHDRGLFTPGQSTGRGGGEAYYAIPFGVDLSTRAYTIFGANEQWRLMTEPVVSYLENTQPRLNSRDDLFPIDFYDEYYRQRRFGLQLHNKLQRRMFESAPGDDIPVRDVLDFNIGFFYYPREKDRHEMNYDRKYSEVESDIVFRPTENLSFSASMNYDLTDGKFNRAILSADWRLGDMFRVYLAQYHYRGNYWRYPDANPSSQTQLAVRTKLWNNSSHYSVEGAISYEWKDSNNWLTSREGVRHGLNKYRLTLFRDMDTFELSISFIRDRNADDKGVYFMLSPKGFMGYESPPPSYTMEVEPLEEGRYPDSVYYARTGYLIDGPVTDADLKDVQF